MKTNNWREEWDSLLDNNDNLVCLLDHEAEEIRDFIQSLLDEKNKEIQVVLDKQKEEIIFVISDSYINSIHTLCSEGTRLWRNELINKLINK